MRLPSATTPRLDEAICVCRCASVCFLRRVPASVCTSTIPVCVSVCLQICVPVGRTVVVDSRVNPCVSVCACVCVFSRGDTCWMSFPQDSQGSAGLWNHCVCPDLHTSLPPPLPPGASYLLLIVSSSPSQLLILVQSFPSTMLLSSALTCQHPKEHLLKDVDRGGGRSRRASQTGFPSPSATWSPCRGDCPPARRNRDVTWGWNSCKLRSLLYHLASVYSFIKWEHSSA